MAEDLYQDKETALLVYRESFRNVQKFLKLRRVKMSHVATYKCIKK
jgi:hypothetical protein